MLFEYYRVGRSQLVTAHHIRCGCVHCMCYYLKTYALRLPAEANAMPVETYDATISPVSPGLTDQ